MSRHRSLIRAVLEPIALAVALGLLAQTVIHIYAIPSVSMSPTLRTGDHILVTTYWKRGPQRGEVVVFRSAGREELLVKRVIGIAGDLVSCDAGKVLVNGHPVREPYLAAGSSTSGIAPQIIPSDCYFVLGDNRGRSLDSRSWGVIRREAVVGRARVVLWSSGGDATAQARADSASAPAAESDSGLRLWVPIG